jgi:hypothetical protein
MGMKASANALIQRHGRTVTLLRAGPPTDDGFGNLIPGPDTEHTLTAANGQYTTEEMAMMGGLLEAGDIRLFVSTAKLTVSPQIGDRLRVDSILYRVVRAAAITTDDEARIYEIQIRRDPVA